MPLPTGLVVKKGSNARSRTSRGHSAAGVGDADLDIFAGADVADLVGGERDVGGGDAHHALAVHRVARVDREVDDGVLELVRVDVDRPGVGIEVDLDLDALAERAVEQVGHAADQLAAVDPLGEQRLGAGEGQQAPGQGGGAGRALHRIVEVHQHFAPRAVQAALGEVDAADHDRQHIVEVVRDAAGQLADRLHLLDLAELGLGRLALGGLGLERLVGLPQFLGALAHRHARAPRRARPRFRPGARAAAFWRSAWTATTPRKIAPMPTRIPSQLR